MCGADDIMNVDGFFVILESDMGMGLSVGCVIVPWTPCGIILSVLHKQKSPTVFRLLPFISNTTFSAQLIHAKTTPVSKHGK